MDGHLIKLFIDQGVLMLFFVFSWLGVYKIGKFIAPLLTSFIAQQTVNQSNIAATMNELKEIQKISNVRLEAIEQQLKLIEGI